MAALYTDAYLARQFAAQPLTEEAISGLAATPVAYPAAQRATLVAVRDVRLLDDGRVGAFIDFDDPNIPPEGVEVEYARFVRAGARWLIDEVVRLPPGGTPAP